MFKSQIDHPNVTYVASLRMTVANQLSMSSQCDAVTKRMNTILERISRGR